MSMAWHVAHFHRNPAECRRELTLIRRRGRTIVLFISQAHYQTQLKTTAVGLIIVLSILTLVQPIKSIALSLNDNGPNSLGNTVNSSTKTFAEFSNSPSAPAASTHDGASDAQVSHLFRDFTTFADNLIRASDQGGSNRSAAVNHVEDEGWLIISSMTANILIFVIGFCGNSLVILVILKFTRIETVTDIYILNLAFADLMFLFGLVFLVITMFIDHWIFGNLMCKLYMASTSVNQFASSLLLVVMSFDRYLAVCHPIYAQRFRRLRRAKIICLCIWITCLILMTPIFAFARSSPELTCAIAWPEYDGLNCERAFTMYSFTIGFAVPLLLIAAFYSCVIKKLRIAASGPIGSGSTRRSRSRETTNRRIEHLVVGIICTYTVCWLPYWITQLLVSFTTHLERPPVEGFYPLVLLATCLTYTNSALNPILYAFLSDNFKRRCADVFRSIYSVSWCPRPQSQDNHSTIATGLYDHSEVHNQNHFYRNNHDNNNNNVNNAAKRRESKQTMVMNESIKLVSGPTQLSEMQKLAPTTEFGTVIKDSDQRLDQMLVGNKLEGEIRHAISSVQQQHPDRGLDQLNYHSGISNQSQVYDGADCDGGLKGDLSSDYKLHEPGTMNNSDPHDNQTRRKSVAFSIGTIVVQGPNNNGQIVKGDHKILQVTDKKLQQRQEAV